MEYAQSRICPVEETRKLLWDFPKQTDHPISTRRPKQENLQDFGLCYSGKPQSKIERMWKEG